jgi:hypothetical protein
MKNNKYYIIPLMRFNYSEKNIFYDLCIYKGKTIITEKAHINIRRKVWRNITRNSYDEILTYIDNIKNNIYDK